MESTRLFLGLDLGTSSLKGVAVDAHGVLRGAAGAAYPTSGAGAGSAEQAPGDWIAAMIRVISALAEGGLELSRIAGIGLSAQMPTFVATDDAGAPLAPAILWSDSRAHPQGTALLDLWGRPRHYAATGVLLDGRYIAPMYQWFRAHHDRSGQCRWILSAKDYLLLWLTRRVRTDPSTASGYGLYSLASGDWDPALCAEAGIDRSRLPELCPSGGVGGTLCPEAASALGLASGLPVACGAADSVAAVLGMGITEPGRICQMAGSSTALIALSATPERDPKRRFLVTPLALPGSYGLEADLLASGTALAWLANLGEPWTGSVPAAERLDRLTRLAAQAPPGADGLLFFPYLAGGEQSVLWNPDLRGALHGLTLRHGFGHIARALHEGLCFEIRRCIEAFMDSGFRPSSMLCSGPISGNGFYMQLLADTSGLPCEASPTRSASALGAAMLAGVCAGAWPDGKSLPVRKSPPGERVWSPGPSARTLFDGIYGRYLAASANLPEARQGPGGEAFGAGGRIG